MSANHSENPDAAPRKSLRFIGTTLLIAGSAIFGGLAVVLWNRKALSGLRQVSVEPQKPSPLADDEDV